MLNRRKFLGTAAAGAVAITTGSAIAQNQTSVRLGYVASKTGINSAGAGLTSIPNYELWALDVNAAGGIALPDGSKVPVEMIAYDDRSDTQEVVRGIERLASQDKVDFILPPWGTGFNLAAAPLFARHKYPHLASTSIVAHADELVDRWPSSFWLLGESGSYSDAIAQTIKTGTDAGAINGKVAMLSVADGFGIELVNAARESFAAAGVEVVLDKTYPIGTKDFSTLLTEARNSGADAFVAFSYPPGSFGLTKQASLMGYNPKIFYTGVGTAFPIYPKLAEAKIEGVMSLGGIEAGNEEIQAYRARHMEKMNAPSDWWASPIVYSSCQMLEQAIGRRGLDREAVTEEIATGTFDAIIGDVRLQNNQLRNLSFLGQWQGGNFVAVSPTDSAGATTAIIPKPSWS